MNTTDFSIKKFVECDYRIKYDIHDCTECDFSGCEEHYNSFESLDIKPRKSKFDLFGAIASYLKNEKTSCNKKQ